MPFSSSRGSKIGKPEPWYPGVNLQHRTAQGIRCIFPFNRSGGVINAGGQVAPLDLKYEQGAAAWKLSPYGWMYFGGNLEVWNDTPEQLNPDEGSILYWVFWNPGNANRYCLRWLADVVTGLKSGSAVTTIKVDFGQSGNTVSLEWTDAVVGEFYQVVQTYSKRTGRRELYVDGLLRVSSTGFTGLDMTGFSNLRYFDSFVDIRLLWLSMWNRPLVAWEVADLNNTFSVFRQPKRAHLFHAGTAAPAITDGEIAAAATSFDNRPFKPDTIFVPSS